MSGSRAVRPPQAPGASSLSKDLPKPARKVERSLGELADSCDMYRSWLPLVDEVEALVLEN